MRRLAWGKVIQSEAILLARREPFRDPHLLSAFMAVNGSWLLFRAEHATTACPIWIDAGAVCASGEVVALGPGSRFARPG